MLKNRSLIKRSKVFLTYSDFTGRPPLDNQEIANRIQNIDVNNALLIATQLLYNRNFEVEQELKKILAAIFINHKNGALKIEELQNSVLFADQPVFNLYKWLLAYGQEVSGITEVLQDDLFNLTELLLVTNDKLHDESTFDPAIFIVQNLVFNNQRNFGLDLQRAFFIYTDLAKQSSFFKPNEFVDFNKDFNNKYGYTIEVFLATIFSLATIPQQGEVHFNRARLYNYENFFRDSHLNVVGPKISRELSNTVQGLKTWAQSSLQETWNYSELLKYPLIELKKDHFMTFGLKALQNMIFLGLFHRIRDCYPQSDTRFLTFFGRPFEKYIELITDQALKEHAGRKRKLPYHLIEEFDYGVKSPKLSSDVYIRLGENLIIVEVKGARLTAGTSFTGDKDAIERDLKKIFIAPIKQANTTFKEILNSAHAEKFCGVKNVYIIAVAVDNFPKEASFYNQVREDLNKSLSSEVKGYFNFSVEEYEHFCYLLTKRKPIFRVLDNYFQSNDLLPFYNFLEQSSIPIRRTAWLEEQLQNSFVKIKNLSFPKTKNPNEL
ncbi:hypothetical protein [Bacillus sp. AK031]